MAEPSRDRISTQVTIGGTPGAPMTRQRPTRGTTTTVQADPTQQYVAGGTWLWYQNVARSLAFAIDDVTADFGADLYERMLLDAQVSSTLNTLRTGILEDGLQLRPAIDDVDDPDYEKAVEITAWCERMLDDLQTPLDDVLWDMLQALALGNRVAEQVYSYDTTYTGKQALTIKALSALPRESTAFVVDSYNRTLGLLGLIPGVGYPVSLNGMMINLDTQPNLLPREKFFVYTCRPRNNDPRGTSLLRPAYDPWNQKVQLAGEFFKYLAQFASPSIAGFTAPDAQSIEIVDVLGNLVLDANGNPQRTTPEDAMLAALTQFRNGTALAFPYGASVQPIQMQGNGEAFLSAFDRLDRQITKAILYQVLATEESQHGTRAQAGVHENTLDTLKRQLKKSVERAFYRDVLRPLVLYNAGRQAEELTPHCSLGVTEQTDQATLITAMAQLAKTNYLDRSQYAGIDEMLGLPARSDSSLQDEPDPAVGDPSVAADQIAQEPGQAQQQQSQQEVQPQAQPGKQQPTQQQVGTPARQHANKGNSRSNSRASRGGDASRQRGGP